MKLKQLIDFATHKDNFLVINNYIDFARYYLDFINAGGVQARILCQNDKCYEFIQYKDDGHRNITRPLNMSLMLDVCEFNQASTSCLEIFKLLKQQDQPNEGDRGTITRVIYTVQQAIGATLDALPATLTNQARKINGDLFERLIKLTINEIGLDCKSGVVKVPIKDKKGSVLFKSNYQHDLLINHEGELKIIGSVKTSSKDRIDKIFIDKFLYSKLTNTDLPHIAIFLNDVQRGKRCSGDKPTYNVSSTFLTRHFKAYIIKLNPLDGVYYCDIRPNMIEDKMLNRHIKTIDNLYFTDLWNMINRHGQSLQEVKLEEDEEE